MNNAGNNIRKSLLKRQEAMARHIARKEVYLLAKEEMIMDIEEARNLWIKMMKQLPKTEFQKF